MNNKIQLFFLLSLVMLPFFTFCVLKIYFLINMTPNKAPNGPFWHLLSPPWYVLLNVHEEHGPNFLHDYVKFDY